MATRIRLRRIGRKNLPLYRIVIADQEAPRDGRFIEIIGTYNPKGETTAAKVQVDAEKARQWIAKGATASDTVQSLLKQAGVFDSGNCKSVSGKEERKRELAQACPATSSVRSLLTRTTLPACRGRPAAESRTG